MNKYLLGQPVDRRALRSCLCSPSNTRAISSLVGKMVVWPPGPLAGRYGSITFFFCFLDPLSLLVSSQPRRPKFPPLFVLSHQAAITRIFTRGGAKMRAAVTFLVLTIVFASPVFAQPKCAAWGQCAKNWWKGDKCACYIPGGKARK
jgi:hypothetical protein